MPPPSSPPTIDVIALVDFFYETNGDDWTNKTGWLLGQPCEDRWFGVGCCPADFPVNTAGRCTSATGEALPLWDPEDPRSWEAKCLAAGCKIVALRLPNNAKGKLRVT